MGKYFSEIQKDCHFDEKERKKQNNDKYSRKQSHEKTRKTKPLIVAITHNKILSSGN